MLILRISGVREGRVVTIKKQGTKIIRERIYIIIDFFILKRDTEKISQIIKRTKINKTEASSAFASAPLFTAILIDDGTDKYFEYIPRTLLSA